MQAYTQHQSTTKRTQHHLHTTNAAPPPPSLHTAVQRAWRRKHPRLAPFMRVSSPLPPSLSPSPLPGAVPPLDLGPAVAAAEQGQGAPQQAEVDGEDGEADVMVSAREEPAAEATVWRKSLCK